MTLAEIREQTRMLIADKDATAFTIPELDKFINAAMRHVANIAVATNPSLLLHEYTGTISNGSSAEVVLVDLSAQTYTKARRIVRARVTGTADDTTELQITDFASIDKIKPDALTSRPPIFLYNETFGFVMPANNTAVSVYFMHGLLDMTAVTDSPGVSGGTGTANKLPVEWQDLIPLRAGGLALSADKRDSTMLRAEYLTIRDALIESVRDRRRTPENG